MIDAEPANGRASIREVYALLAEVRHETESQLANTEDRLMRAIVGSEQRIIGSLGDLGMRVAALEEWRRECEKNRAVSAAAHDGRWWFPRMFMRWVEDHWKLLTVIAFIIAALAAVVVDVDIHAK